MREPHRWSISERLCSKLSASLWPVVLAVLLSSCSTGLPVQHEGQEAEEAGPAPRYSIVCIIHGDGDYLYHDTGGNEFSADVEALASTMRVAEQNPGTEMFIFDQKPRRRFLFLFPLDDGEFSYYRSGRLIAHESYRRDPESPRFNTEAGLYRRFHVGNEPGVTTMFLYFGHEIPEFGGAGYDASSPDRTFTVQDLATGLEEFTGHSRRFDLMVLSTCFGGTPYTVGVLGPFARYIVASPDNLHLSYFDLRLLEKPDPGLPDGDVHAFAKRFAHDAFDRLAGDIQTAVSVAVYDVDHMQEYVRSVHRAYDRMVTALKDEQQNTVATFEHCDCADLPAYVMPAMNEGVDVFYRPARFGRSKNKVHHSGWECWRQSGEASAPGFAPGQ